MLTVHRISIFIVWLNARKIEKLYENSIYVTESKNRICYRIKKPSPFYKKARFYHVRSNAFDGDVGAAVTVRGAVHDGADVVV